ncbi:MAG: energy transducer TonB [Ignavibacteriota bacterium]
MPEYARKTIRGAVKIQVRAKVNAAGHVEDATVESHNSKYFAKLTLEAVRQWEFAPVPGEWLLRFEFTTAGTTVHPSRLRGRPLASYNRPAAADVRMLTVSPQRPTLRLYPKDVEKKAVPMTTLNAGTRK